MGCRHLPHRGPVWRPTAHRCRVCRFHITRLALYATDRRAHLPSLHCDAGGTLRAGQPLPQLAACSRRDAIHARAPQHARPRRRVHAHRGVRRAVRRLRARRGPSRPHQPVPCQLRLGAGAYVQRRVRAREPPPRRRLQAASERWLRHLRQPAEKAAADASQDGYRYGALDRYVQAHESASGPQDYGGDQEGGRQRRVTARQLHGPHPSAGEPGALRRPQQPHQAAGAVQALGGAAHGRVLSAGRPRARTWHGHQSHVRPTQLHHREVASRLHRLHRAPAVGDMGGPGAP